MNDIRKNLSSFLKNRNPNFPGALLGFLFFACLGQRAYASNAEFRTQNQSTLVLTVDYNGIQDVTTVGFNDSATYGFDAEYDADKPDGGPGRPTLYTYFADQNEWYAINTIPLLTQVVDVLVGLRPQNTGTMTLSAQGIQTFDATTYIYLEDKKTGGPWFNMRNGTYTFNTSVNDSQTRFVLHFSPPAIIETQATSCTTPGIISMLQPGSAYWNYTILNKDSVPVSSGILDSSNPVSASVNAGIYMVILKDSLGYTVVKTVQVDGAPPIAAAFAASDTLVQVSDEIIFTSSTSNVSTFSWNFGDGSGTYGESTNHSYDSAGVYVVTLTVTNSSGCTATDSQTITVMPAIATGTLNLPTEKISIWSSGNTVYVDFSKINSADARVQLYNGLGQTLSDENFGGSTIYSKQLSASVKTAYILVKITRGNQLTSGMVFINGASK